MVWRYGEKVTFHQIWHKMFLTGSDKTSFTDFFSSVYRGRINYGLKKRWIDSLSAVSSINISTRGPGALILCLVTKIARLEQVRFMPNSHVATIAM